LLDLKFPTFWFDNTPQGKFMLSIAFGQSKYYVDNLSENVKRGNRQKLRKGILPNKAPYGYFNEPRLRTIEVDPVKSKIVKKAFELFAAGESSLADISRFFQKFGITRYNGKMPHLDTVKRILSNKFYIGIINFGGETFEGTHKLFIPLEVFDKIQEILKAREHPKNKKHNFTFFGFGEIRRVRLCHHRRSQAQVLSNYERKCGLYLLPPHQKEKRLFSKLSAGRTFRATIAGNCC